MSADNWAVCPKCQADRDAELAAAREVVTRAYGKVPIDEFDRLRRELADDEARNAGQQNSYRTFREDYEIYDTRNGQVKIEYEGRCTDCKTGVSISVAVPFWPALAEATVVVK